MAAGLDVDGAEEIVDATHFDGMAVNGGGPLGIIYFGEDEDAAFVGLEAIGELVGGVLRENGFGNVALRLALPKDGLEAFVSHCLRSIWARASSSALALST